MSDNTPESPPDGGDHTADHENVHVPTESTESTVLSNKLVEVDTDDAGSDASSKYYSTSEVSAATQRPSLDVVLPDDPMDIDTDPIVPIVSDLLHSVNGMFRVLDLFTEQGSGGLVSKIIIDQDSLKEFINELSPGAYSSQTKVDFKTLDTLLIKPAGLYGSRTEIVAFLSMQGAIDELTANALNLSRDDSSGPALRSGLYLLRSSGLEPGKEQIFVIYWPEDTTWDDNAASSISRNRATFMRYLTKMCDQVTCLISPEHAKAIVWSDNAEATATGVEEKPNRLYRFTVAKTNEQEETVVARPGFKIASPFLSFSNWPDDSAYEPRLLRGETHQAILTTEYVPAGTQTQPLVQEVYNKPQLQKLLEASVEFSRELPDEAIESLVLTHDLMPQYQVAFDHWQSRRAAFKRNMTERANREEAEMLPKVAEEMEQMRGVFKEALIGRLLDRFPIQGAALSRASDQERGRLQADFIRFTKEHGFVADDFEDVVWAHKIDSIKPEPVFRTLKENLTYIQVFLELRQDLIAPQREKAAVELSKATDSLLSSPRINSNDSTGAGFIGTVTRYWPFSNKADPAQGILEETRRRLVGRRDAEFLAELDEILEAHPFLHEIISRVRRVAVEYLTNLIRKLLETVVGKAIQGQQQALKIQMKRSQATELAHYSRVDRDILIEDMGQQTPVAAIYVTGFEVKKPRYVDGHSSYKVLGFCRYTSEALLKCKMHPLSLTADDREGLQMEPSFVPSPQLKSPVATFTLLPEQRILHAQLIEHGDLLLIVEDPTNLLVYLDHPSRIGDNVASRRGFRKGIYREKIGENAIIAYDEPTRMLLICASTMLYFHLYTFDETYGSLQGPTSIDLTSWYMPGIHITHACFVCGSEEILVVDSGNSAKIYSLPPRQFRPATAHLQQTPVSVYSSPDGACLLLSYQGDTGLCFRAYHWSTFGSSTGIELGPLNVPGPSFSLTSLVNRRNVHLMSISAGVCQSVAFDITKKTTEFMFKEAADKRTSKTKPNSLTHNCLVDCHSDVWTRFPVIAAVQRQTIVSTKDRLPRSLAFSTYCDHSKFSPHFEDLICSFEQQTRKPTGNDLAKIKVSALKIDVATSLLSTNNRWHVSEFRAGEWIVDLLCLIPIQIAITQENRFVPLKDGVISAALEHSLLGAEVGQIVDALSIGWYESVFQSYMVSKPVKVVSSMGEQSVGKSFCLNHLVDTSFAGSAMRTTEGVWMSVTPTDNALIVALDFEGVHSIERSAQEDTLLVLFNTAISNLVLFRNNFAMSRSIAGLFQSFQSSSTVLDPAANPQLFKSTLVIIIKDVVDSDEAEIVREFKTKFQKIVEDEQAANFISRLHAGQLDIIPWPVIESKQFYSLFPALKRSLDEQEVTHATAGEFLHTLKTLMAKLKANDWGALSETLAAHRAQKLSIYLTNALAFGFYETEPTNEPLKNFDTDDLIEHPDTLSRFFLSSDMSIEERQPMLSTLQMTWDRFDKRHQTPDSDWTAGLATYLMDLAEMRISHVFHWIKSNLSRFKSNHANMDILRRDFESGAVDLKSNVEICRMQCATCELLCLLDRRHDAPHDCMTSHDCTHPCDLDEKDNKVEKCGYHAGHSGKHICVVGMHLCGETCTLSDKNGCMKKCTKVAKHSDEGHMCAARIHASLSLEKLDIAGRWDLFLSANMYNTQDVHYEHECSTPSCPMACVLCKRLCANTDHLHGLKQVRSTSAGNNTAAKNYALLRGFAKSTQRLNLSKRLLPAITKPSNIPSTLKTQSVCAVQSRFFLAILNMRDVTFIVQTLLYSISAKPGHPQQEHETSHGSMSKTTWAVDGDNDTVLELKGRKFASNDDGAPMMCSLVCQDIGRHVHIDYCRAVEDSVQKTGYRIRSSGDVAGSRTLILGTIKPILQNGNDAMCPGPEHAEANPPTPSYCSLPILHAPPQAGNIVPVGQGYVSLDGHLYTCQNPAEMLPTYHVIFVIDKSWSMSSIDLQPLPNRPGADLIIRRSNNRLGAVFSSLHAFWMSRFSALDRVRSGARGRRDAYSVVFFDHEASVCLQNDTESSPDDLLTSVLRYDAEGLTDSVAALSCAETVLRECWNDTLTPVVIFLSDGECADAQDAVESLARAAVELGNPLSFHSVLFGTDDGRESLDSMAQLALEIQTESAVNPTRAFVASSFSEALDEASCGSC
ncbi:hypothetical protein C8J57DRAFT_1519796 [Mycena rebaudengoi]|nr:hypothetical protein C8J57DRAFT_1519796 [Mycena rebaudengoi]